jgi:iron complex outermembrane recepter protein
LLHSLGVLGRVRLGSTEKVPLNLIEVILAQGSMLQASPLFLMAPCVVETADLPSLPGTTMANFYRSKVHRSLPLRHPPLLRPMAHAVLLLCVSGNAFSQNTNPNPPQLDTVTVTGRTSAPADVSGWGDVPTNKAPFQSGTFNLDAQRDRGFSRLSNTTKLDPAVSDAYNSEGYWDYLTIRGYVVDNRYNYRRDGLPISAETSLPLDNKDRIEILKGTSGLQSGVSSPGGLVNLVVKRPLAEPLRSAFLEWRDHGALLGAVDISQRFGKDQTFGLRVNAAYERLDSSVRQLQGHRKLLAVAGDWRINADSLLEAEFETSQRSQRSQPAFSLLGNSVPALNDARINLNNQPWSLPVVMDADTYSLRYSQRINPQWRWTTHAASQRLVTQDRLAFPFGCGAENNYDRYCSDGSFDLYDYRSEDERRRLHALEVAVHGQLKTGAVEHSVSWGVQQNKLIQRFQMQAYNYVGTGNVQGSAVTTADPTLTDQNTNRDERSTEFFVRDAIKLTPQLSAWLGLRHSRLARDSVRTNGSRATSYQQSFTTPWLAASMALNNDTTVYASWGQGIESDVAPNRARFTNAGQALPALRSRQTEIGLKNSGRPLAWSVAWFDISRPVSASVGPDCFSDTPGGTCSRQADGQARHQGIELTSHLRSGPWTLQGGVQWLHARRQNSQNPNINGKTPANVPTTTLKLQARYDVAALPGLALLGDVVAESKRWVLPDNSVSIPSTQQVDLGLRYRSAGTGNKSSGQWIWRVGVSNVFDQRRWRESPYQFDHAYLYPMAPRTFRLSVQTDL